MIPKVIHYCWFGRNPKPLIIKKCIKSWEKFCPDYKIIEWNEDNFDIHQNRFCSEAYEMKKWAFVSDYARLKILYDFGGIYMDTDVELIRPIDDFLANTNFIGFQHEHYVNSGLIFGSEREGKFVKEQLEIYENMSFIQDGGKLNMTVCQEYTTGILRKSDVIVPDTGKIQYSTQYQLTVYPSEYFCPIDIRTGSKRITENTYAIHHFTSSWWDAERLKAKQRIKRRELLHNFIHIPNRIAKAILGNERYESLKGMIKGRKNL